MNTLLTNDTQHIHELLENDHPDEALMRCEALLNENPQNASAHYLKGLALRKLGNLQAAKASLEDALQLEANSVDAHFALGNVLRVIGDMQAAERAYLKAIGLDRHHQKSHFNLGLVYHISGNLNKALASYDEALGINPSYSDALNNKGNVLKALGDLQGAYKCYSDAVAIKPSATTYFNIGLVLQVLSRPSDAVEAYKCAVKHNANYSEAWAGLGFALQKQGSFMQAVDAYKKALTLKPDNSEVWNSLGVTYKKLKLLEPAIDCFARAVSIKPDFSDALGSLVQNKLHACDWKQIDKVFTAVEDSINQGGKLVPFNILATPLSAKVQKRCAEQYTTHNFPPMEALTGVNTRYQHSKIRIGYFSADLHNHATAYLMADLFERHDRSVFEIIGFSFGSEFKDEMALRVRQAFDAIYDVGGMSDIDIAKLAVAKEIDIAVDLKGYTRGARPGIFAYMPAPVQVSYLGYPGTLGAPYIQYLIADKVLIPIEERVNYTEKIAYMSDTYQVNAKRRVLAPNATTRQDHGIPEHAFVFCCFNNNYKITPDVFDIWLRLLHEVEHGVLWLFEANPSATVNLRSRAQAEGISPERLIFAKKVSQEMHLSRYYHADLVLDTFHYNAHTTTSDALWVGCPVLTCLGSTFPGRVAASILEAFGMPEMITTTPEAYYNLAKKLALDTTKLKAIRQQVAAHRDTQALFDIDRYTIHIEQLYQQMYQRHQDGLPADHLS
jgi:protein O-GlcNAc transferase